MAAKLAGRYAKFPHTLEKRNTRLGIFFKLWEKQAERWIPSSHWRNSTKVTPCIIHANLNWQIKPSIFWIGFILPYYIYKELQGTGTLISWMSDVVHLLPCCLAEQRNPVTNRRASHFLKKVHHETITQLSLVFGCYSWIKGDFEVGFDNI